MNRVYLSLGANIEPEKNLLTAVKLLAEMTSLVAVSSVWKTAPVGLINQPDFLNAAAIVETELTALAFKQQIIGSIERQLGRLRQRHKNAPRPIDIDIMLYNQQILKVGQRYIPDAEILERAFVAIPLAEIAPDYCHPEVGQTLAEIAQRFSSDPQVMEFQPQTSHRLKKIIQHTKKYFGVNTIKRMSMMYQTVSEDTKLTPNGASSKSEQYDRQANIEQAVREILVNIGEDPDRNGLQRTPERIARMYEELTAGYHINPQALINDALFEVNYSEMVLVKDIDFFSLCEHHMLPFFGKAHVAYIPDGKVLGLSKIPRVVEMFARRLQVQERMTQQIVDFMEDVLNPLGVAVVIEGRHMCSMMRGIKKSNAKMITSAVSGNFQTNSKTRAEFMNHIG